MPPKNYVKRAKKSGGSKPKRKTKEVSNLKKNGERNDQKASASKSSDMFLLSVEQKEYLGKFTVSEDEPGLLILWNDDVVETAISNVMGGKIASLPSKPEFLDTTSPKQFKDSILAHLCELGGGSLESLIAPNNWRQYDHVLTRLVRMEIDPYIPGNVCQRGCPTGHVRAHHGRERDTRCTHSHTCSPAAPCSSFSLVSVRNT